MKILPHSSGPGESRDAPSILRSSAGVMRLVLGGICGVVATGPMTATMILWHRRLPSGEKYPLPPSEITSAALHQVSLEVPPAKANWLTLVAHFAYGGAAGSLFGFTSRRRKIEPIRSGMWLGFLLWAVSYFGLLPAARILQAPTEMPARRNVLMLGAHFIWGVCVSALLRLMLDDFGRNTPAMHGRLRSARDVPKNRSACPVEKRAASK